MMKTRNINKHSSWMLYIVLLLPAMPHRADAQQWQQVTELPGIEMTALFATGDTLYVGGTNKIYFTYDGGSTWDSTATIHPNVDFITTLRLVQGRLFAGTLLHGVFRSDNGGQHWQADNTGLSGLGALQISSLAERGDSLYAGTYGAGVFVRKISTNSNWGNYSTGLPWQNVESLTHINGKLFAGAGANSTVSTQAYPGHTWTEKPFAVFNGSANAFLGTVRQGDVWLAAGTSGLYRSTDAGDTWTFFNPGTGILGSARFAVAGGRVFANLAKPAAVTFIQYTDNQGLDWKNFEPEITGSYGHDLAVVGGRLYSARSNGLWRIGLPTAVDERDTAQASIGAIFPNPFSSFATVPVTFHRQEWADVSIFDSRGARVETLWQGILDAGAHELRFDANGLPPGVYICRLTTPSGILSRRVVLVK